MGRLISLKNGINGSAAQTGTTPAGTSGSTSDSTIAQGESGTLVSTDSTLLASPAPDQYDFYYSQKQAEQFVKMSQASYTRQDQIKNHRFRDKTYTAVVAKEVNVGSTLQAGTYD